ncbi:JAB domain-containing protein [Sphingobacterium cellulitidis]
MKILFSNAIKTIASKIILSNNHPSEKLKANTHEFVFTKKAIKCG